MDEQIKHTLEIIEKLESRINTYWNFYTIVVVAVIGWLLSSKTPFTVPQGIALTIAILMFFTANFSVMRSATKRVIAFESELNIASKKFEFNSNALKSNLSNDSMPRRLIASYILHGIVDLAVIYAIWSKLA